MITTIHLLVGAVIGKYIKSIWLIIILALISHYILDFIPHYSPNAVKGFLEEGIISMDVSNFLLKSIEPILGIILVSYFIFLNKERSTPMIIGVFFAWFPDLLVFISDWLHVDWLSKIVPKKSNILYNQAKSLTIGILTQVMIFISTLTLLLLPKRGVS